MDPVVASSLDTSLLHYELSLKESKDERDVIQKRTFTKWINKYLMRRGRQMQDLFQDLRDGQNLITLLEMLSGTNLPRERGRMRVHQLQNIQIALNYIKFRKVKLVNIRPEDIVDGNQKLTLGLIWTIILHFQLEDNSNFRELLLRWAQKTTDGYPGCNVTDLTTSWRDGLAFNAIIHRNRPDLLDYRACRKKTSRENLEQAFSVADRDLGVARLLEPEDVDVPCPDEKSMITYLSQLYELFPNPPERNPLLDEEKLRRVDEYKELASRLLKWIRESTTKLEDRRFPKTIPELKKLKEETENFRTQEVPPKQHDKQRLAAVAREVYKMAHDLNVKVPDDLHIDNIDYHWDRMMNALKARSKAIDDELAKADRLRALLDKLLTDIKKTNERLDGIEGRMNDEDRRISRLDSLRDAEAYSPIVFQKISEDLADCGIKIDAIKRLADEFCNENGRTAPDSIMIREKVAELDGRYKKLLNRLGRLNDLYAQTLERLRNMDNELRRQQARKEAEAKLRLKLDEMKRRLDELERRIDNMGPVSKDVAVLQRQLAELQEFDKDLKKARDDLNDLIVFAEKLIADDLIVDPVGVRTTLQALKDQLARIEDKAARRLREFDAALEKAERQKKAEAEINLKLDGIKKELDELERRIDNMAPVGKDLATLKHQLDELKDFEQDVAKTRRNLNDVVRLAEDFIRDDLITDPASLRANINILKDQLARIDEKVARRLRAIKDALNRAEAQREAEERFNLRLDAIKRELDDLERRLDSMAPVSRDLNVLQQQLAEMQDFNERLNKTRANLKDVLKAGEDLIREDLIADPATLRANMKSLKDQLARIEDKAAKRLKEIQDAMGRVAASDAIQDVAKWLERAKKILINEENVHGDLDTVNALIEQHKSFQQEIQAQQPAINEVRRMEKELSSASPQTGAAIRDELNDLINQWRDVERLTREKSAKLEDALRAAEQMHDSVHGLLEWLADAEMKLRFAGSLPEDEKATNQELVDHEKFMRKLASQGQAKDQTLKLARDILTKCHPDAEPVIKHWINIIQSRWEEIEGWAKQRGQRLTDHLRSLTELLELVEELIGWLTRHEGRLLGEETEQLPTNANQLESMIDAHATFMDELRKHEPSVDKVVKIFASRSSTATSKMVVTTTTTKPRQQDAAKATSGRLSGGARSATPTRTSYATYRDEYPEVRHPRARIMLEKWRTVWQLSLDKMQRLKDRVEHLKEMERLENFDFDQWRRRFLTWVNTNKGRVMDFFRSIDDDNDGRIPIEAFISGVLRSKFETSRLEMERVADIFDKNNDGTVDNKEYLDSLRPDKPITDDEIIQDEVQRQVSKCTCPQRYRVYHVGEGRYRFGESQKLRLVRILRSTVMVRVGGGWEPLTSFLQKNDPCRARGRTNVELREQFILPEGASQAMATFKSKMSRDPGSVPALGPITKVRTNPPN
uniref:Microtubule-actin cross-linking factor 1 n=1 Tax=Aceria tosichella TaxID=561515 RepID=A0A6G1S6P5_9ACAR